MWEKWETSPGQTPILHGPTSTRWSWAAGVPGCTPAPQTWCSELCTATSPAVSRSENHPIDYKQTTANGKQPNYLLHRQIIKYVVSPSSPLYLLCVCVWGGVRGGEQVHVYLPYKVFTVCVGVGVCVCMHLCVCMCACKFCFVLFFKVLMRVGRSL